MKLLKSILPLVLMMVVLPITVACTEMDVPSVVSDVSEVFVEHYYVDNDVKGALQYTTGEAKKKLMSELDEIEKYAGSEESSGYPEPQINTHLESAKKISETQYDFTWRISSSEGENLKSKLSVVKTDQLWLVNTLKEVEK